MQARRTVLAVTSVIAISTSIHGGASAQTNATQASSSRTAPQADAQNEGESSAVKDIVVTAQRRSERLQDVPVAVTAITADKLANAGIATTQDLSIATPGLSLPQTSGSTQPHIRGVGSSATGPGLEPPVATYIDGVYIASASSALLTLNNVERVEVLKGPQGTLFGRNATGGLIQIVTREPTAKTEGAVNLGYGSYDDVVADAYVSGGLANGLFGDVAVRFEHQGRGWGRNLFNGDYTYNLPHDFAGRAKLRYAPSTDTDVVLAIDYEDRISRLDTQTVVPGRRGTYDIPSFGGPYARGDAYDINSDINPRNNLKSGGVSLKIDQSLGESVGFESITAYRQSSFHMLNDIDQLPRPVITVDVEGRSKQFSQELQLHSQGSGKLTWVGGVFYYRADDGLGPGSALVFGPNSPLAPTPFPVPVESRFEVADNQRTESVAGYAQATYEFLRDTRLTLGGRYTWERKRFTALADVAVGGTPVVTLNYPEPGGQGTENANNFSYRIALDHKFARDILAYVSYNTGFKSGGFNSFLPANPPFSPETIRAGEIGLKTQFFDRRLRLNVSAFRYRYNNIQVGRFVEGNEAIFNAARAKISGADLDAELVVAHGLDLTGGFAYTDATFSSFPNADFIIPVGGCTPPLGGVCSGDASGNRLPFTPKVTFDLGADYKVDTSIGAFRFDANYFRSSSFYANPDNVASQPAYDLINASIGWTDLNDHLSLKLFVRNLGGTRYATTLLEANQGVIYTPGAPRTFGATAGFRF